MTTATPSPAYTTQSSLWYVHSRTDRNHYHAVVIDPATNLYRCECKDHLHRKRDCWHIRAVQSGIVRPATLKAKPEPQPATTAIPVREALSLLYGE